MSRLNVTLEEKEKDEEKEMEKEKKKERCPATATANDTQHSLSQRSVWNDISTTNKKYILIYCGLHV